MKSGLAPVALFAYNRPSHLERTLRSLLACEGADLTAITVFIDGPKSASSAAVTEEVRRVALDALGARADIRVQASNQGLSNSIIAGVGALLAEHGTAIVVEDDLTLAPQFLEFMNAALQRYRTNENVFQVSGHMFDVPEFADRSEAMFLPFTTTWGWATWDRAWKAFDATAAGWIRLREDKLLRRRFDLNGVYPYTWLMERQQRGQSDSWGIRWYWSVFKRNGVSLFPPVSMVRNNGQDGSGTHGKGVVAKFNLETERSILESPVLPDLAKVNAPDFALVRKAIWRQNGAWKGWALNKFRQIAGI
ncbi:glycosyltransferase [Novosphingobium sp. CCH12-A3]|uniref:glycosyltransferase n=1 Tax=Novosphingobium sp. CCH12-A3 TaxID=1768752 RepID=UPI0007821BC2|nr:glycosyltransferase [Novosphingobium sp. CCH12-A3]